MTQGTFALNPKAEREEDENKKVRRLIHERCIIYLGPRVSEWRVFCMAALFECMMTEQKVGRGRSGVGVT